MKFLVKCPKIDSEATDCKNDRYNEAFFESFSLRDWCSWNSESGFELVYEDSEIIKKIKVKNGK